MVRGVGSGTLQHEPVVLLSPESQHLTVCWERSQWAFPMVVVDVPSQVLLNGENALQPSDTPAQLLIQCPKT